MNGRQDVPDVDFCVHLGQCKCIRRAGAVPQVGSPPFFKSFIIRLQEFTGRAATVKISVPATIKSAMLMNITESVDLGNISDVSPLTVTLRPFECATVRIEIE